MAEIVKKRFFHIDRNEVLDSRALFIVSHYPFPVIPTGATARSAVEGSLSWLNEEEESGAKEIPPRALPLVGLGRNDTKV